METQQHIKTEGPLRKRGRPRGKGRVPLSMEERRARNAQYERERRIENAVALAELAKAAGCPPEISNADILATVVSLFQRASNAQDASDDLQTLRRTNQKLMEQIQSLEYRITTDPELAGLTIPDDSDEETYIRTHANTTDRKKIKIEVVAKPESTSPTGFEFFCPAPAPAQLKRECTNTQHLVKQETTPIQEYKPFPTIPVGFEEQVVPVIEQVVPAYLQSEDIPTTNGSAEPQLLDALQAPSWPEVEVQNDDGVLDYMRQWSVEDFVLEYL